MRDLSDFRSYQHRMHEHILNTPFGALFTFMGGGKTVTTLTAIDDLLRWCEISKPLIVAPRLVAEKVWVDEISAWSHINHLCISKVVGTAIQRKKALTAEADIWVIGRDNIPWLVDLLGAMWPFDMVVLDESTSFKSHSSLRFKKMRQVLKLGIVRRMVQLTGTPVPNGLMDLWAPLYLLDQGERLGTTFSGFRNRYFEGNEYTHRYKLRTGAEQSIHNAVSDICVSMRKSDWLDVNPRLDITRKIELPDMKAYKQFEEDSVLQILGAEITAVNAGALYSKLLQFCNGAVYDQNKNYHIVNNAKLDALEEMIESLNGEPVIIFYCFQSDIERIKLRIKNVRKIEKPQDIDDWNAGKISVALGHPAGIGHGLNMQFGGWRIIWFGVPSPLEWYQQAVERIDRPGQKERVINTHLITQGTLEEKVVTNMIDKTLTQDSLMEALKAFKADIVARQQAKSLELV